MVKHDELQGADLERLRDLYERNRPNCPERVPVNELQLVFADVVGTYGETTAANDAQECDGPGPVGASGGALVPGETGGAGGDAASSGAPPPGATPDAKGGKDKRRHPHGRRRLDLTRLPVEHMEVDPEEVKATGGEGFIKIGEETSDRIAFRPASFFRLRIVRRKWVREVEALAAAASAPSTVEADTERTPDDPSSAVLVAPLPAGVWPNVMADPSAVAQVIISKYDDVTPLARQEHISDRQGFALPRSTQCGWLTAAYDATYRIVSAMFDEARRKAFCIATDATGARMRAVGTCDNWHVFVFIADQDHVVFRFAREHTSATIAALLHGFRGYLLSDAAPIYDVLHASGDVIEVACWYQNPESRIIRGESASAA